LPLQVRRHKHEAVHPFLEGLLPDNLTVLESTARRFGVSARDTVGLLSYIGADCAGAVQFCAPDAVERLLSRSSELVPVGEQRIGERLNALRTGQATSWLIDEQRWSLAGFQPKLALHRTGSGWADASGDIPSTHIVKPGIASLSFQALNEHVCLLAAAELGLNVASSEYASFAGEPAIIVTRYDRLRLDGDKVVRVHQEDLCQALGYSTRMKYESDGGPSALQILRLLSDYCAPDDCYRFVAYLAYNYLVGAPDSHAKNFSVLLVGDTVRLAPMYDVASVFPYETEQSSELNKLAFAIGGARVFGTLTARNWGTLAVQAGLDEQRVVDIVYDLARRLPDAMKTVLERHSTVSGTKELSLRLLPRLTQNCASAVSTY
jgi:serine/threonine-protein kinase HipA